MSIAEAQTTMTVDEFLALPDDGTSRELIRGELKEYGMTVRNRYHAASESRIAQMLANWNDGRPEPRGEVVSGEAGFRLQDSVVGIDVALTTPEQAATEGIGRLFEGPPLLAVEILSPSDKHEDVVLKVETYFEAGTAVVWEVDPDRRTIVVRRPNREPVMFTHSTDLTCEPELPGFRVPLSRIFRSSFDRRSVS